MPAPATILSYLSGVALFEPSVSASVSLLNIVYHIGSSSAVSCRRTLTPLQRAIVAATTVSLIADLVMVYACGRALLDESFSEFTKWMVAFNALKRAHSLVSVHIGFLRFQIVTGNLRPPSAADYQSLTANTPALASTACYGAAGFAAVSCQIKAYLGGNWISTAARASREFAAYRAMTMACTTYLAALESATNVAIVAGTQTATGTSGGASTGLTARRARLRRVVAYYNHWILLAYEALLIAAFLACSVAYFYEPAFNAGVCFEQAVLSFAAWNGYVLLHASVAGADEDDDNDDDDDGSGGGREGVVAGRGGRVEVKVGG